MVKPNLFIVGAPKCGTTSLAIWLDNYVEVYLPKPKEPNYFSFDLSKTHQKSKDEYEESFKNAGGRRIVLDASTRYLFSSVAVPHALEYSPAAKFIALVRNPVDMFFSLHNHLYQTGLEPERSPRAAWDLQWQRQGDRSFRRRHPDPDSLRYADICKLGEQAVRFVSVVPARQRKLIALEEMRNDAASVFESVQQFLALPKKPVDLAPENTRFEARSQILKMGVRVMSDLKRVLGIRRRLGILEAVVRINRRPSRSLRRPSDLETQLEEYFSDDIGRLVGVLRQEGVIDAEGAIRGASNEQESLGVSVD